jgi:hypothetical protein
MQDTQQEVRSGKQVAEQQVLRTRLKSTFNDSEYARWSEKLQKNSKGK